MSACPCWRPENGDQCPTCGEVVEQSATELRQAAETLRQRVADATGEPWVRNGINGIHTHRGACVATSAQHDKDVRRADADYIATMHPRVGLIVAELIQQEYDSHVGDDMSDAGDGPLCGTWPIFLDLARLINGS